jgi:8-oxo-dGTP pyrophosphatase MutT (NUDIX family)
MPAKPFVLSVKILVRDGEGRILLLKRSMASNNNQGKWDLPGGKVDAGEAFDAALLREVAEETGLEIFLDRVAGAAESDLPDRKVAYLILEGHVTGGAVRLSEEHADFAWVDRAALVSQDVCPQFRPFVTSYSRGGGAPWNPKRCGG